MAASDSKSNIRESATAATASSSNPVAASVASQATQAPTNHLEIPANNPNLLSPDILSQRRGEAL